MIVYCYFYILKMFFGKPMKINLGFWRTIKTKNIFEEKWQQKN